MDYPVYYYLIGGAVIVLIVVLGSLLIRRKSGRAQPPQNPYVEALKLLVDGRRGEAFTRLQVAAKTGYAPTDAYIKLGNLLRERGEVSKALQIHQSLTVRTNLSRAEEIELYLSLAEDHAAMGSSEKAVKVLDTAMRKLSLKDADLHRTLSKHFHVMGQHERAYNALKEAKKLGGATERELALYMTSAAEVALAEGERKEARKTLQRALRHDSNCAPCLLMLGDIAEEEEELDTAIDHWRQVAVVSPELAGTVLHKLETTLFEKGRFGDIEKIYNDVRAARSGDEAACLGLASFYKKQGRGEEAITLLEEYLTVHPDSAAVSLLLASFYEQYRDSETLERFLDDSMKDPLSADQYECQSCHLKTEKMRWHCPRCNAFDSFSRSNHEM
jgi:lipopolysaccharide biosynthesis regulator YciM